MARFCGNIGFAVSGESPTQPGVWVDAITERRYYGSVISNVFRNESSDRVIKDINISNSISIVADSYLKENFANMRYIQFMGANWNINSVKIEYPRIILEIGGVYNGPTYQAPQQP